MKKTKAFLAVLFIAVLTIFIVSGLPDTVLSLINENIEKIKFLKTDNPYLVEIIFFTTYVVATSISLPVALILGLLSGMIFDAVTAIILVSFASAIGATFAFLISRYLFRDYVEKKFYDQYQKINTGFIENSGYYLCLK